jgi:methyl-accepting chemotaxis protein
MNKTLRFSHKILLAVSLIVMLAFTLFTLYNDYLQRSATRTSLENYLAEMGESTSTNIRNLLEGRINLVRNLAQNVAREPAKAETLMSLSSTWAGPTAVSVCVRTPRCPMATTRAPALGTRTR